MKTLFALFAALFSLHSQAYVVQIQKMEEIKTRFTPTTMAVFDIDNTILSFPRLLAA